MNITHSIKSMGAGALAAGAAFVGVAVGAPIVLGQQGTDARVPDNEGPVTERVVVATGSSKTFGPYELVSSRDADGNPCVGVRFVKPPIAMPSLTEGCGDSIVIDNQVGRVASEAKSKTLFWGRVRPDASAVKVRKDGAQKHAAKTVKGQDGRVYVLTEADEYLPDAEIGVAAEDGSNLGRVDPVAAEERQDEH